MSNMKRHFFVVNMFDSQKEAFRRLCRERGMSMGEAIGKMIHGELYKKRAKERSR